MVKERVRFDEFEEGVHLCRYWLARDPGWCVSYGSAEGGVQVDVAVVEVGLGGARDATNIFDENHLAAAVITPIGLEHAAALGALPPFPAMRISVGARPVVVYFLLCFGVCKILCCEEATGGRPTCPLLRRGFERSESRRSHADMQASRLLLDVLRELMCVLVSILALGSHWWLRSWI